MQMLFDESEEFGTHRGLGLIPGRVVKIPDADVDGAPFCQERMAFFSSLYERSGGASWQEANFAVMIKELKP